MRITIHQPEHMPWLGFFHKIDMADTYVVLDNVPFRKNYFQNRNKIRTAGGWQWITVPVKHKFGQLIKDIPIGDAGKRWKKKYWDSIQFTYKKAPFFKRYSGPLKDILEEEQAGGIAELNFALIKLFLEFLNLRPNIVKASGLKAEGSGSSLLLEICRKLGAAAYISGVSGRDYLNMEDFKKAGVEVIFQEFHHPIYKQLYEPFMPCMSVMDLLFNHGDESLGIIRGAGVPVVKEVFV